MKKKIYIIGVMTVLAITCFGCGKKDVADNDNKITEAATEITESTEAATTEDKTKKEEKTTESKTEDKKAEKSDKKKSDSKSDKSKAANTDTQSNKAVTQPANESKPVVTTNSSTGNTGSNTSANNNTQQTTECQHNWVAVTHTVHHDAVMGSRLVEEGVRAHWYCYNCQKYYITASEDPCGKANGSEASYVLKEPVWEDYEVTPAYDETVTDYYKCSKCGVTR